MMSNTGQALNDIDWDFVDVPSSNGIYNIHPYPAKFIPQIPKKLIELFPPQTGTVIFDPFCGSGTTLVEGTELGLEAWGVDLHPLACMIARVKTTPLSQAYFHELTDVLRIAQARMSENVNIPSIPNVDHWFKPGIQKALALLVEQIDTISDLSINEAMKIALSSIIVQVSNQDSDTRYAAVEKNVTQADVFDRFEKAAMGLGQIVTRLTDTLFLKRGKATIINADILSVTPHDLPKPVGLVVTSPPYPNAYEYWLYHKYRMYWLGMDPIAVREREIGARPHYFKTNHQDETDFEEQMSKTFFLLSKVMIPYAKACFVVGRSIIHGREIDNVALLQRAATPHGFEVIGIVERQILKSRKSFNLSHGKINREHIVVFEKLPV